VKGESSLDLPNRLKSLALESWLTPDDPRLLCEQVRSGLEKNKICPYQLPKTAQKNKPEQSNIHQGTPIPSKEPSGSAG